MQAQYTMIVDHSKEHALTHKVAAPSLDRCIPCGCWMQQLLT
jgi:hypothetical protein